MSPTQAEPARVVQVRLPTSGTSLASAVATWQPSLSASRTGESGSTQPSISMRRVRPVHRARARAWMTPDTDPAAASAPVITEGSMPISQAVHGVGGDFVANVADERGNRPFRGRADPARAAGHLRDHHAHGIGRIQPPGQRERRQQRMARPARRAPQPGHEDLPAAARLPDITPVPDQNTPAARRTTGRTDEGTRRHGRLPHRHRPQAGTAIRWPRATPPRNPSRDRRKTRRGGIPHIQRGHGGDVAAER